MKTKRNLIIAACFITLLAFLGCEKPTDNPTPCHCDTLAVKLSTNYTAEQYGYLQASVNGLGGLTVFVNDQSVWTCSGEYCHCSVYVRPGEVYRIETSGVAVGYFYTICR